MQLEAAQRLYALNHEKKPYHDGTFSNWAAEPSRDFPFHFTDGVRLWMAREELAPDDDWLGESVPEQTNGEQDQATQTHEHRGHAEQV